jgi:hypothetical protein
MPTPQIQYIDCNYEKMMEQFGAYASSILPFRDAEPLPQKPMHQYVQGKLVVAAQDTVYYDSKRTVSAWIERLFFEDESAFDYPIIFQVGNNVYLLTDYSLL